MAYSKDLADRIRMVLLKRQGLSKRKIFGGICFIMHGHMCCDVTGDERIVRVDTDRLESPMTGFVYVDPMGRKQTLSWSAGCSGAQSSPPRSSDRLPSAFCLHTLFTPLSRSPKQCGCAQAEGT
jgi:hypothetical protein